MPSAGYIYAPENVSWLSAHQMARYLVHPTLIMLTYTNFIAESKGTKRMLAITKNHWFR